MRATIKCLHKIYSIRDIFENIILRGTILEGVKSLCESFFEKVQHRCAQICVMCNLGILLNWRRPYPKNGNLCPNPEINSFLLRRTYFDKTVVLNVEIDVAQ